MRLRDIFRFWLPVAASWLMMAAEGPIVAAVIARLPDAKPNLAANGIAFTFAIIIEAPVIMLLSAATALATDGASYRRLRAFANVLNAGVTAAMLVLLAPPVFALVFERGVGLTEPVLGLTHRALALLLPWPAVIGYRRFYQGIMIRRGRTGRVVACTVVRLAVIAAASIVLSRTSLPGAVVGAATLSAAVTLESAAAFLLARGVVRETCALDGPTPSYGSIWSFYTPLALTAFIGLVIQPVLTFFMNRSPHPLESLAVYPVVHSFTFLFRSMGLSYQEVSIALLARGDDHRRGVRDFAWLLGGASALALAAVAFTPLAVVWYADVSNLTPELTAYAIPATQALAAMPLLSVVLSYQRALLVNVRRTAPISWATAIEVCIVAAAMVALLRRGDLSGVTAASAAILIGRLAANAYLAIPRRPR